MLPNLIVIGARKCGTTSLHYYLSQHPEISMSKTKELNFFVKERNWARGLAWYESQFRSGTRVVGESSPGYTEHPYFSNVPDRMARVVPDAKLVYVVRDPIERIISGYIDTYGHRRDPITLADAVSDFENSRFVQASKYFMQLERYLPYFPDSRVLVIAQEDLRDRRRETLRNVFRFLDVDDTFVSPKFGQMKNPAHTRRKTRLGELLHSVAEQTLGEARTIRLLGPLPPSLKRPFTRRSERPVLDESLRTQLVDYLKPDVEQLRAHTGLELERWSV